MANKYYNEVVSGPRWIAEVLDGDDQWKEITWPDKAYTFIQAERYLNQAKSHKPDFKYRLTCVHTKISMNHYYDDDLELLS